MTEKAKIIGAEKVEIVRCEAGSIAISRNGYGWTKESQVGLQYKNFSHALKVLEKLVTARYVSFRTNMWN